MLGCVALRCFMWCGDVFGIHCNLVAIYHRHRVCPIARTAILVHGLDLDDDDDAAAPKYDVSGLLPEAASRLAVSDLLGAAPPLAAAAASRFFWSAVSASALVRSPTSSFRNEKAPCLQAWATSSGSSVRRFRILAVLTHSLPSFDRAISVALTTSWRASFDRVLTSGSSLAILRMRARGKTRSSPPPWWLFLPFPLLPQCSSIASPYLVR
mmetsp:Transcript_15132/g.32522  ORF Transcript_15132/g.32522 Transcript_15132/m.32522 type:complete len:211 (-) Transcript_15132:324-956(-)